MANVRKTDRRTVYTLNVIQQAFLKLIDQQPFAKITVAQLCREADITRSTFYLHYSNLNEVLDAVLDQALLANQDMTFDADPDDASLIPACQRIAGAPKYRLLLMDPDLSEYIIGRIAQHEHDRVVPQIVQRTGLSDQAATSLFLYMLHGSFAINRRHHFTKTPEWYADVKMLQKFIDAGYGAFHKG